MLKSLNFEMSLTESNNIGFVVGSPASQALREVIALISEEDDQIYQPRPRRYEDFPELLTALEAGDIDAALLPHRRLEGILDQYPALEIASPLRAGADKGFILGTNQIGQDIFSRIIWGTRIALIVGLSSAIVAFVIGVPLGLISGFVGGPLDRVLTLVMDSLYAFPGLILAIAITAVLGAGIGNIIVAIAVLYVPTYFRIVRGQTLSVKEELYVEAARSLGAKAATILASTSSPT